MDTFLVSAQWEYEGSLPLVAFKELDDALNFIAICDSHNVNEPDEDDEVEHQEWENNHPGKPYLSHGDHLCGVETFAYSELKVL